MLRRQEIRGKKQLRTGIGGRQAGGYSFQVVRVPSFHENPRRIPSTQRPFRDTGGHGMPAA
jgi:hypothetical protein